MKKNKATKRLRATQSQRTVPWIVLCCLLVCPEHGTLIRGQEREQPAPVEVQSEATNQSTPTQANTTHVVVPYPVLPSSGSATTKPLVPAVNILEIGMLLFLVAQLITLGIGFVYVVRENGRNFDLVIMTFDALLKKKQRSGGTEDRSRKAGH